MFMDQKTCSCEEGSTLLWMSGLLCPALGTGAAPPSQLTVTGKEGPTEQPGLPGIYLVGICLGIGEDCKP